MNIHAEISAFYLQSMGFVRPMNGGWAVFSETGKKLSKVYKTKHEAVQRLKEIEYFKNKKASILTYSETVRFLRKNYPNFVKEFQKLFKSNFEKQIQISSEDADIKALNETIQDIKINIGSLDD